MKEIAVALVAILSMAGCGSSSGQERNDLSPLVKMAEAGDPEAMYSIFFRIAQKGSPEHPQTDEEIELAQHWLIKAGEKNNCRAAYVLQLCHEVGCWGLPIDMDKSKHYKGILERCSPNNSFNGDAQQQASPAVGAR